MKFARLLPLFVTAFFPSCQAAAPCGDAEPCEVIPGVGIVLEVYVSPLGNDSSGQGTQAAPFASLERARDAVAEKRKSLTGEGDIVVWLDGGTYEQSAPLVLTESDGGTGNTRVVYRAMADKAPVIVGGRRITGWQRHTSDVYKVALEDVRTGMWSIENLVENNKPAVKARFPNSGYLKTTGGTGRTLIKAANLPAWQAPKDAQAVIWAGHDWFANVAPITKFDKEAGILELGSETAQGVSADNRFFLQGALEALDQPGEFHVDREAGVLYYWPTKLPIEDQAIYGATSREVVSIKGSSATNLANAIRIEGIRFVGSNFAHQFREHQATWNQPDLSNRYGLISVENASNIQIVRSEISGAGFNCIAIRGNASNVLIKYNHIHDCGYHGVLAIGADVGTIVNGAQVVDNHDHTITGNHIHHVGRLVGHSAGIFLFQSGNNTITHNEIHDSPRYGIGVKGSPRWGAMKDLTFGDVKVTWDNHWTFLTGRNNEIANNHIHHVVTDSDDAGAITFWGTGRGNIIKNNLIRDLTFNVDNGLGQAIYLDDAADYTTIDGNVIYGLNGKVVQGIFAKGINSKLFRNIVVLQNSKQVGIRSQVVAEERVDHHVYRKNIIYFRSGAGAIFNFSNWTDDRLDESDENLFFAAEGELTVRQADETHTLTQWKDLGKGWDKRSQTANPRFTDAAANDFTFGTDSPLHALGLVPLRRADVGLPADFPF